MTFLANIKLSTAVSVAHGIAIDESTALRIDQNGVGTVVGDGHVYFVSAHGEIGLNPGEPMSMYDIRVHCLHAGDTISTTDFWDFDQGDGFYTLNVIAGVLTSDLPGGAWYC